MTPRYNQAISSLESSSNTQLLSTEQEVCMEESWPRSWLQTERSEDCAHDRGQDSPLQTD